MTPLTKAIIQSLLDRELQSTSGDLEVATSKIGGLHVPALDRMLAAAQDYVDNVAASIKEFEALP